MIAWIVTILMFLACEGIYRSMEYLLQVERASTGPPFYMLVIMTSTASLIGWMIYFRRKKPDDPPPVRSLENVALQSIAEESFRFLVFGIVFGALAGVNSLLGYQSISYHLHPWIDRLGWPGMWAALISSFAFTALHVRKDGNVSGFMPIIPSVIFTLALVNYGVLAATVLHLVYNGEGMAWLAFAKRRPKLM